MPDREVEIGLVLIVDDQQVIEMVEVNQGLDIWVMYVRARIGPINMKFASNVEENVNPRAFGGNQGNDDLQFDDYVEQDEAEELTISGPIDDSDDIESDNVMKIVEPWMLGGLEGPDDDDIFAKKNLGGRWRRKSI